LKTRSWDGPESSKIFRTEIVVENLVLLSPREDGDFVQPDMQSLDLHQNYPVEPLAMHPEQSPVMEGDIPMA
jgi:single-stranded DNA-binding protein